MEVATATTSTCSNEYSSSIFEFLQLADLLTFKEKFAGAGVTKVEHLQDVEEEDLKEFGMIDLNISFTYD